MSQPTPSSPVSNRKLITILALIVVGMSGFAFALVPLYEVFCEITGINGKTRGQALYQQTEVNRDRQVTVEFVSLINRGMPWDFKPEVNRMVVHPGEIYEINFRAKNRGRDTLVAQAVPSLAPGEASLYFNKTECFCFEQQPLVAGASADMPLKFFVDSDLPEDIETITLSYTLYNVTPKPVSQSEAASE